MRNYTQLTPCFSNLAFLTKSLMAISAGLFCPFSATVCFDSTLSAFFYDVTLCVSMVWASRFIHLRNTLSRTAQDLILSSTQNCVVAHQKLFLCLTFGVSLPREVILWLASPPNTRTPSDPKVQDATDFQETKVSSTTHTHTHTHTSHPLSDCWG